MSVLTKDSIHTDISWFGFVSLVCLFKLKTVLYTYRYYVAGMALFLVVCLFKLKTVLYTYRYYVAGMALFYWYVCLKTN